MENSTERKRVHSFRVSDWWPLVQGEKHSPFLMANSAFAYFDFRCFSGKNNSIIWVKFVVKMFASQPKQIWKTRINKLSHFLFNKPSCARHLKQVALAPIPELLKQADFENLFNQISWFGKLLQSKYSF